MKLFLNKNFVFIQSAKNPHRRKPDLKLYDRSKMHYGTVFLVCDNPKHLYGDYYTDRKTIGSITFEAKTKIV